MGVSKAASIATARSRSQLEPGKVMTAARMSGIQHRLGPEGVILDLVNGERAVLGEHGRGQAGLGERHPESSRIGGVELGLTVRPEARVAPDQVRQLVPLMNDRTSPARPTEAGLQTPLQEVQQQDLVVGAQL